VRAEALRDPAILLRMGVRSGAAAATKRLLLETLGWVLTFPAAGAAAALVYVVLRALQLP
jgi:hypothetical protein